jgi:hypothetical protein
MMYPLEIKLPVPLGPGIAHDDVLVITPTQEAVVAVGEHKLRAVREGSGTGHQEIEGEVLAKELRWTRWRREEHDAEPSDDIVLRLVLLHRWLQLQLSCALRSHFVHP